MSIPAGHMLRFHRARQFFQALTARDSADIDDAIRRALANDDQWRLVQRLPAFDRQHLWEVRSRLVATGWRDSDLLRAALLHDVGKADAHGRIWLADRVLLVLGRALAPSLLGKLTERPAFGPFYGLYLAVHHAALGAAMASQAGVSDRCCWLIKHHDQTDIDDSQLRALIEADRSA